LKYKDFLYCGNATFTRAYILDSETCVLSFYIDTQEIPCLISKKTGEPVENNDTEIQSCRYLIEMKINPDPLIDELGHYWLVVGLQKLGAVKQLI
jgi:hypothetical protein